jgi:hypothetical protein
MSRLIVFLICTHLSLLSYAAENDSLKNELHNIFSINTGYSKHVLRDGVISPFIYRGSGIPIEIEYRFLGTKSGHYFYAFYDNLKLKSSIPDYPGNGIVHYIKNTNIQLGYAYQRMVCIMPAKSKLFLGGELSCLLNLRDHYMTNSNDYIMLDQFNSVALNALVEKRFKNEKQLLFINFSIPIISYVLMRGTYNAYVGEKTDKWELGENPFWHVFKDGNFVSFDKLVDFKTDITYIKYLGKHIGIQCKYNFRFYKFTQYDNLFYSKSLQNQFQIGIVGKF